MKVDRKRITDKIQFIRDNLDKLEELSGMDKENFLNDYRNYDTAKYNLQSTIEAMLDIANHIISRKELGNPETNAESFRILEENNIIDKELLAIFVKMAKFRNRVVHLYDEIDDEQIYDILNKNLTDYKSFINIIVKNFL